MANVKVVLVGCLGCLGWLAIVCLAGKLHVAHYRSLVRTSRKLGKDSEFVRAMRAGQVAGVAVGLPLIVSLAVLEGDLTVAAHNGLVLTGLTLGMALTYAIVRGNTRGEKRRPRRG